MVSFSIPSLYIYYIYIYNLHYYSIYPFFSYLLFYKLAIPIRFILDIFKLQCIVNGKKDNSYEQYCSIYFIYIYIYIYIYI